MLGFFRNVAWMFALLAMAWVLTAGQASKGTDPKGRAPDVPEALRPPTRHVLLAKVHARGIQIYARANAGEALTLKEPVAELYNERDEAIGRHYKGPTWEGNGGKFIGGTKTAAPSPDVGAIDWLLIEADSSKAAERGLGLFSNITYIQRINTKGGKPPADSTANEVRVAYEADYLLYGLVPETK